MIIGMDVSSYPEMKDKGYRYYDENGTEIDVLEYGKKKGFNYGRLRLWNAPQNIPESGGYCDLLQTIAMAKRLKSWTFPICWISIILTGGQIRSTRIFRRRGKICPWMRWHRSFLHLRSRHFLP